MRVLSCLEVHLGVDLRMFALLGWWERRWDMMDDRAVIAASCWLAVAIISSVYMWVFRGFVADLMFGVFLPVGLLVLVAIIVTFWLVSSIEPERKR